MKPRFYPALMALLCFTSFTSAMAEPTRTSDRSIRLNNYNDWMFKLSDSMHEPGLLDMIASRENICFTEVGTWTNLTPRAIKAKNASAKVYRLYDLCIKNRWDSDWSNPIDLTSLQTPLTKQLIDASEAWLRDGNGEVVKDEYGWLIDVGKPGIKEAFLDTTLKRMKDKGFDGVVFDYWISDLWPLRGKPRPKAYPTNADWAEKAWTPFILYVMNGLHKAGYRIIGNCAGEYRTADKEQELQRALVDGVNYEQWVVGWKGEWLPGSTIEKRISAFRDDPLEAWTADIGVRLEDPEFSRKNLAGLAMYYVAIPQSQDRRSFHSFGDAKVRWDPLWNVDIGVPAEPARRQPGKYFWSRKYTRGLVLLNYEEAQSIAYTLDSAYRDSEGKTVSGEITIPPHTGRLLCAVVPSP